MATIYTPARSSFPKTSPGVSDCRVENGVYKFMGCSVLSISMTLGFNGTASSVSVTLVEDTVNGDLFVEPTIPSVWAISVPRGGVGVPVIYTTIDLNPNAFNPSNTPFYFAGICTNFSKGIRDIGGQTISVTLVDPREVLTGVQCLLSGFALSQEVGVGARYLNVHNVIDVFGFYDYGMDSDRNEYGMQWFKIRNVLANVRVMLKDISFEFLFTGETFLNVPEFYRIDEEITDIIALCQRVADDSGSDFICIARKINDFGMVVELRGIKRTNFNPLTKTELASFVLSRKDIVESVRIGKEFKNEPNSSIIVGGMRNSNYLVLPSEYDESMHLSNDVEDYNVFPYDIKARLFGGKSKLGSAAASSSATTIGTRESTYRVKSGGILPFWGFTPDDHAYPLVEPFLPLDHLLVDKRSSIWGDVESRIPQCKISVKDFSVRQVEHTDVFLPGDGDSDDRPFAFLEEYQLSDSKKDGYIRGLPLNTEVLRAALVSEIAFYTIYSLYYPDIAQKMLLPSPDWTGLKNYIDNLPAAQKPNLAEIQIGDFLFKNPSATFASSQASRDAKGNINKSDIAWDNVAYDLRQVGIMERIRSVIYEMVREYAVDHMGKRFIAVLPKSNIMQRIWNEQSVPTRPEKPEIEYVVDQVGYWEKVPTEFDGIAHKTDNRNNSGNVFTSAEEEQIRRKFMAEDGRFYPMAIMDWKPEGNINFNSNGLNKALFQDLPTSEFRPNMISSIVPKYVFISCSVNQLLKRPDLALVELPGQVSFDPTVPGSIFKEFDENDVLDDEYLATKAGVMHYLWYLYSRDSKLRSIIKEAAQRNSKSTNAYAVEVFQAWAKRIQFLDSQWFLMEMSTEFVMDLKGIVIPLTSTWMSYGPYYYTYDNAKGMVDIQVHDSLVPWNFDRPEGNDNPYSNLDAAGQEILARTLSDIDYLDTAFISVAGFPEFGPAYNFGYNSNITGISIDFGVGGVKTTYNMGTYSAKPGTFRKAEYDNVSRARIDTREVLPEIININPINNVFSPSDRQLYSW